MQSASDIPTDRSESDNLELKKIEYGNLVIFVVVVQLLPIQHVKNPNSIGTDRLKVIVVSGKIVNNTLESTYLACA